MINYIKKLCESFVKATHNRDKTEHDGVNVFTWPRHIYAEIKDLKTTDFEPEFRYEFVLVKEKLFQLSRMGSFSHNELPSFRDIAINLNRILGSYVQGSSDEKLKEFNFIYDASLKNIIQRDYKELHSLLIPDGAWKSAVILSGSILESMLYDILTQPHNIQLSNSSDKAPKYKGKVVDITSGKWKLITLIDVAVDINILPIQRAASIDQVLRDYRNFVHPQKEIKSQHPCTEAEAYMAKGCLDGIYNHLSAKES